MISLPLDNQVVRGGVVSSKPGRDRLGEQPNVEVAQRVELALWRRQPSHIVARGLAHRGAIASEEPLDGHGTCFGTAARVGLGMVRRAKLGRTAFVRDDDRQPLGEGFGDGQAEGLARATVHEGIGRGERRKQPRTVFLEAHEAHMVRRHRLQPPSFWAVSEENQRVRDPFGQEARSFDDHFPSLFDGESPEAHQERSLSALHKLRTSLGEVSGGRGPVHPERNVLNAWDAMAHELVALRLGRHEGRVHSLTEALNKPPSGSYQVEGAWKNARQAGGSSLDFPLQDRGVRVQKVGMPPEGPDTKVAVG